MRVAGTQTDCPGVIIACPGIISGSRVEVTQLNVEILIVVADFGGTEIGDFRPGHCTHLLQDVPELHPHGKGCRIATQAFLIGGSGLSPSAVVTTRIPIAKIGVRGVACCGGLHRVWVVRSKRNCAGVMLLRPLALPHEGVEVAQLDMQVGVDLIDLQRLQVGTFSALQIAHLFQGMAELDPRTKRTWFQRKALLVSRSGVSPAPGITMLIGTPKQRLRSCALRTTGFASDISDHASHLVLSPAGKEYGQAI